MKFDVIKKTITLKAGRTGLVIKKYSPEILITVGVVGVVTSTVMACKATLKADILIDEIEAKRQKIKYVSEVSDKESYSEADQRKDMLILLSSTIKELIKIYGPSFTLGVASVACILGAHNIMQKRNVALIALYKATEKSFMDYRQRVIEDFGTETDMHFKYGVKNTVVTATEIDADGKKTKVKTKITEMDPDHIHCSQYARFFDESCPEWSKTPEYNLVYLRARQNYANDLLQSRGHVFLNEVYDSLGMEHSQAGAIVGWVKGEGDNFIDFNIYTEDNINFVNGYERSVLLDFNVDGVIYDLI